MNRKTFCISPAFKLSTFRTFNRYLVFKMTCVISPTPKILLVKNYRSSSVPPFLSQNRLIIIMTIYICIIYSNYNCWTVISLKANVLFIFASPFSVTPGIYACLVNKWKYHSISSNNSAYCNTFSRIGMNKTK